MDVDFTALKNQKNLLAFSGGVDSSALFFLLLEHGIAFDIAIVDYGVRAESKKELQYAQKLAKQYDKKIYIHSSKKIDTNFEHRARSVRYEFFHTVCTQNGYNNLVTAHQLDDRFEWFMMQLSRGAGLVELLGFEYRVKKSSYCIVKPLLNITKAQLLHYLKQHNIQYFIDVTNSDPKYRRNYFRRHYSAAFLSEFANGVKKSFDYLEKDREKIDSGYEKLFAQKEFFIYEVQLQSKVLLVTKVLKELGYVVSAQQRKEIEKQPCLVIGGRFAVETLNSLVFICPFSKLPMDKRFKERCRIAGIPRLCRPYLYENSIDTAPIETLISRYTKKQ